MKKFILASVLLVALCLPAEGRMIIGLTPVPPLSGIDQATLNHLASEMSVSSGTDIEIRGFDNNVAITNWLLRFQEIDAAVVAPEFIKQQPAGTLQHLADLHAQSSTSSPLALVVRSNLSNSQATLTQEAFLKLGASNKGRKTLGKMGLVGVSLPGEPLKRQVVKPQPQPAQPAQEKVSLKAAEPKQPTAPQPQASPAAVAEKPRTPTVVKQQPPKKQVVAAAPAPKLTAKETVQPEPEAKKPKTPTTQAPAKVEVKPTEQATQVEAKKQLENKPQVAKQETQAEAPQPPEPESNKRLVLFASLILLLAILFKVSLFVMRWQSKRNSAFKAEEAPDIEPVVKHHEVAVSVTAADVASDDGLVVETGRLGSGKVPALLKRCADLPKPVVLHITKGSCEKLVYFAGGQVSGALTQNTTTAESGVRWNKLGNLLVREELISSDERDQGMALLTKEPGLRFGEALLKLGLIDLSGLRHALTRQAKVTIYSLILFPEGRYQVLAGDGALPPEESVSLEITNLIREASQHQSEWTAIRKALPNLNMALGFSAEGRDKLEKVSLSPQQEATLSLIDGQCTINDLCVESSMMDYEVYRFLYLMVKAGVLE